MLCDYLVSFPSVIITTDSFLFHLLDVLKKKLHLFTSDSSVSQFSVCSHFEGSPVERLALNVSVLHLKPQIGFFLLLLLLFFDRYTHTDFQHSHRNKEGRLILDSGALNSPYALAPSSHTRTCTLHIKMFLMNVLLGQFLRKRCFSSPSVSSSRALSIPLSLSPPPVHAPLWTCLFDALRQY